MNPAQHLLIGFVRLYRVAVSPVLTAVLGPFGFGCRFTPTCSHYALDAVRRHGAARGSWLATKRLCRCQPWCEGGFDPVPDRLPERTEASAAFPRSVSEIKT